MPVYDDSQQQIAKAIVVAFPILSVISVALRFYTRRFLTKHIGADDWLVLGALVLQLSETFTTYKYIETNFIGIHFKDIPVEENNVVLGQKYNYANQLLYNPILSLVKMSVILFLLRVNTQKTIRIFAWTIYALTLVLMVLILCIDIFQCWPLAFIWDRTTPDGKCINQGAFFVSTSGITLLTDILVLIIPTWITFGLQMRRKQKLIVIGLLSLGLAVTAIGLYRMILLIGAFFPTTPNPDPTYSIGFVSSAVETNIAILTACAPALKPLVMRYLPRILGTSRYARSNPSNIHYYGQSGRNGTRYGQGTQVTIQGGHNAKSKAFEMGTLKRSKKPSDSSSADNDSEKGIMTYDGIIRSIEVDVSYVSDERDAGQGKTPGAGSDGSDASYIIQYPDSQHRPGASGGVQNAENEWPLGYKRP